MVGGTFCCENKLFIKKNADLIYNIISVKYMIESLSSLKDVAKYINQLKRDDENLRSVQDVQER